MSRPKGERRPRWGICLYLVDGPRTVEQLKELLHSNPLAGPGEQGFAAARTPRPRRLRKLLSRVHTDLSGLIDAGWVVREGDGYALTPTGRVELEAAKQEALASLRLFGAKARSLLEPAKASKLTVVVQVALALIKLPAGLLSGSIGLLNDSLDTILDLLSSLLVFLGVRFDRERLVSYVLVAFMTATGGFTLYEAVSRFLTPYVPQAGWFPFVAAILSAVTGLVLWQYQRYVGKRSRSMSFVAESVDSRNHVIVALGVTAGLIASRFGLGIIDMIVGLLVALLIVWSAIELIIELARSSTGGEVDLSHYGFWLNDVYEHGRDHYLRYLSMFVIDRGGAGSREELIERLRRATDFSGNQWTQAVGLDRPMADGSVIVGVVDRAVSEGLVVEGDRFAVTAKGAELLARKGGGRSHRR